MNELLQFLQRCIYDYDIYRIEMSTDIIERLFQRDMMECTYEHYGLSLTVRWMYETENDPFNNRRITRYTINRQEIEPITHTARIVNIVCNNGCIRYHDGWVYPLANDIEGRRAVLTIFDELSSDEVEICQDEWLTIINL